MNGRVIRAGTGLLVLLMLGGCASMGSQEAEHKIPKTKMTAWLANKPRPARRLYRMVLIQGKRDRVLNEERSGLAAFQLHSWTAAEQSFDDAITRIETVYADNPSAKKARSKFAKESVKDFKGQPYERAMAFYYRGLLYLVDGDYENARASFKGGLLQDTMAENKTFSQDFAILSYLSGWASQCNGEPSLAKAAYAEALTHRSSLETPNPDDNALVIYESGQGPIKAAVGKYKDKLAIAKGRQQKLPDGVMVADNADAADKELGLGADLFFQATTRGGRKAHDILVAKAKFKQGMATGGVVLATAGLTTMDSGLYSNNSNMEAAGAAMEVAGLLAGIISHATHPEADARYWDNLPGKLYVTTLPADKTNRYVISTGAGHMQTVKAIGKGHCKLVWARSRSALKVPERAPHSSPQADRKKA